MATLVDSGLLQFISPAIVFILVCALLYALILKTNLLGENKAVVMIIAAAIGILFLISSKGQEFIASFSSWFTIFIVLFIFVFIFFLALGAKQEDIMKNIIYEPTFVTFVLIGFLVLFLVIMSNVYGPIFEVNQQSGFWNATKRVLFHPKFLGVLFLIAIGAFTVKFLAEPLKK